MAKWTPEKLVYGRKTAVDPQLSPNGEWVVYAVAARSEETKKADSQLWISKRDGSEKRRLTYAGASNGAARWSPDGASIAFISDRGDGSALYLLSFAGGDPKQLAAHRNGISAIEWSADGTKLAYSVIVDPENPEGKAPEPGTPAPIRHTTRIDYKWDTRGYLGDKRGQVFVYDLAAGEETQLTQGPGEYLLPRWSPDGKTLAAWHPTAIFANAQIALIDATSGTIRTILPGTGAVGSWTWTKDSSQLLITADHEWSFQPEFHLINVSTGEGDQLTHDLPVAPSTVGSAWVAPAHPVWLDDRRALFTAASKGRTGLFEIDVETGQVAEKAIGNYQEAGFGLDASLRYVARVRESLESTGEVTIYDRETGASSTITDLNGELLAEYPPAQWERFDIERNGYTLESWILKPADFDPGKKYPLILDIHGGPNGWYGYDFATWQQIFPANDFVLLFSNPRGSGSYGGDFTRQVQQDWGGEDYLDLMAVVDEAIKLPYVDAERTGVYGYSYGGFMTSWVIGHTDRFKAAIIGAPCSDLVSMFGTSDIGPLWGPIQWGGTPWDNHDWYVEHSPITHMHKAKTPTLIVQAEGDVRCPIGQGEQVFATLKKIGVETEFVRYPGGDHLFFIAGEPTYQVDYLSRLLAWFKAHLGEPV